MHQIDFTASGDATFDELGRCYETLSRALGMLQARSSAYEMLRWHALSAARTAIHDLYMEARANDVSNESL